MWRKKEQSKSHRVDERSAYLLIVSLPAAHVYPTLRSELQVLLLLLRLLLNLLHLLPQASLFRADNAGNGLLRHVDLILVGERRLLHLADKRGIEGWNHDKVCS